MYLREDTPVTAIPAAAQNDMRKAPRFLRGWVAVLALAAGCGGPHSRSQPPVQTGPWRAWLESPGGDLPFGLEIEENGPGLRAFIRNGMEKVEVSRIECAGREAAIYLDEYGSELRGRIQDGGKSIEGKWRRTLTDAVHFSLPFRARAGKWPRFNPEPERPGADTLRIDGRWRVDFGQRPQPSVGVFSTLADGSVGGTILTSSGDLHVLSGSFEGNRLRLSRFDGGHAFLLDARLQPDGSLAGDFWEGGYVKDSWVAHRDSNAQLTDPLSQFRITGDVSLASVRLVDLEGRDRILADPALAGKALVVEIMGTWCPNCHDCAELLGKLFEAHRGQGLSVIGVSFEAVQAYADRTRLLRAYRDRYRVPYPLLLASKDSRILPEQVFPSIQGDYAFPTILFLRGDGSVRAVYKGFVSRAAPGDHERLQIEFESLIAELLGAGDPEGSRPR